MSETRYVRLLPGPGRAATGTPIRMSAGIAEDLVSRGIAEYVETAAEPPTENAMLDVGRPSRPKGRGRKVERR